MDDLAGTAGDSPPQLRSLSRNREELLASLPPIADVAVDRPPD